MVGDLSELDGAVLQALEGPRPFRRRFQQGTLRVARQLLVEGQPAKVVAFANGINTKRVYAIKKQILAAVEAEFGSGPDLLALEEPTGVLAERQRAAAVADGVLRVIGGESIQDVASGLGIEVDSMESYCSQLRSRAWSLFA